MTLGTPAPPMVYTITIWLMTEGLTEKNGAGETWSFDIRMTDPCFAATIDLSGGVVPDTAPSYTIGEAADV